MGKNIFESDLVMTDVSFRFVENMEKLLIFFFFIAEWRVGKNILSSALLSPDLPGGDHPGHPRLVILRLAV